MRHRKIFAKMLAALAFGLVAAPAFANAPQPSGDIAGAIAKFFRSDAKVDHCLQPGEFTLFMRLFAPIVLDQAVKECRPLVPAGAAILNLPQDYVARLRTDSAAATEGGMAALRRMAGIPDFIDDDKLLQLIAQNIGPLKLAEKSCTLAGEAIPLLAPLPIENIARLIVLFGAGEAKPGEKPFLCPKP